MPPVYAANCSQFKWAMNVVANGDPVELDEGATVDDLLKALGLGGKWVVVERNREILRDHALLPAVQLADGDVLEIVHFVGGG